MGEGNKSAHRDDVLQGTREGRDLPGRVCIKFSYYFVISIFFFPLRLFSSRLVATTVTQETDNDGQALGIRPERAAAGAAGRQGDARAIGH